MFTTIHSAPHSNSPFIEKVDSQRTQWFVCPGAYYDCTVHVVVNSAGLITNGSYYRTYKNTSISYSRGSDNYSEHYRVLQAASHHSASWLEIGSYAMYINGFWCGHLYS